MTNTLEKTKKELSEEPTWICLNCASKRGAIIPEGHCPTWHPDMCGICEQYRYVTEPRDFGRTRKLLTENNNSNEQKS